jgi:hypothetical protein
LVEVFKDAVCILGLDVDGLAHATASSRVTKEGAVLSLNGAPVEEARRQRGDG